MTRKHFIALADSLGLALRDARNTDEQFGVYRAIDSIIPTLQAANSAFDRDRFKTHIHEVAHGERKVTT